MPVGIKQAPKYCLHKPSGRAYIRIRGRVRYIGKHGSPESLEAYGRLVAELAAQKSPAFGEVAHIELAVVEVTAAYWKFAQDYYRKRDGTPSGWLTHIRLVLTKYLSRLYGRTPAVEFGPKAFKAIRQTLIDAGHSRPYINKLMPVVTRAFKWAAAEELVPASIYHALRTVEGLKKGRTTAPDREAVKPVDDQVVEATLPHLPPIVADMVRFERLVGCRPGEVCQLRPLDVDRNHDTWAYRPASHKTEHHDRERVIFIGPKAQAVLLPYLLRAEDAYCFSSAETEQKRREACHAARKTPANQGNRPGTNRKTKPERRPRDRYTKDSYNKAIQRGCEIAFGMPKELRRIPKKMDDENEKKRLQQLAAEWRAKHCWSPNQLRHAAGTDVRRKYGLEAAQVVLGHAKADVTQVYAERDMALAAEIMQKIG